MSNFTIPGSGWDTESVVYGYIKVRKPEHVSLCRSEISDFDFDYPFTNIFWLGNSEAAFGFPVIGFAGSYKQIEEDWNEWMWKYSQLLRQLDAVEARVSLECAIGHFSWKLEPRIRFESPNVDVSMAGQDWGIVQWPTPDFCTDDEWLKHCSSGKIRFDSKTGKHFSEWPMLVPRWNRID